MIVLKETQDVYNTIKDTFKGDNHYLQKLHFNSPCGINEATVYTANNIFHYTPDEAVFYSITEPKGTIEIELEDGTVVSGIQREKIGYVCIFGNIIHDFGVNIKYRERLDEIWEEIKRISGENISVRVFNEDERLLSYLIDKGFVKECGYATFSQVLMKNFK